MSKSLKYFYSSDLNLFKEVISLYTLANWTAYAPACDGLLQQALVECVDCARDIRHTAVRQSWGKHSQTIRKNVFSRFSLSRRRLD